MEEDDIWSPPQASARGRQLFSDEGWVHAVPGLWMEFDYLFPGIDVVMCQCIYYALAQKQRMHNTYMSGRERDSTSVCVRLCVCVCMCVCVKYTSEQVC